MSEPTCRALCYSGADCLSCVRTYLPCTVLQGCRLYKRCRNLPAGHCATVVQAVETVSEPTCRALCYSGADCLSNVRTYLLGTVLQWCRLFEQCLNLPAGHSGEACFSNVRVYLPGTVLQCYSDADCLSSVRTYLPGTVLQWCRLFKRCQNLPAGHCGTVVQTV